MTQSHRHKTQTLAWPSYQPAKPIPSHAVPSPRLSPSSSLPSLCLDPLFLSCYTYFYFVPIIVPSPLASSPFQPAWGLSVCGIPPSHCAGNRLNKQRHGESGIIRLPCLGGLARCIPSYITAATSPILGGETQASNPHRHRSALHIATDPTPHLWASLLDARPDQHNPASYPNKINQDRTQATRETGNSGGTAAV